MELIKLTGDLDGGGILGGNELEGGDDVGLSTAAIFSGQRAEHVSFLALNGRDDTFLDVLTAHGSRVHQRDALDLLSNESSFQMKFPKISASKGSTYSGDVVGDGGDGRVTSDAVAALVGHLGLDQDDRFTFGNGAGLNFVGSRATTNHVTLFEVKCFTLHEICLHNLTRVCRYLQANIGVQLRQSP